ncbi:MAG: HlyD family secretion protein [Alphaproteobacteria bacterium]|nr:HlyD family secretion protein [Alphaproteobacteria bacterium]
MNDAGPDLKLGTVPRVADPRRRRKRIMVAVVVVAALALVAFAVDWVRDRTLHVYETDARIVADMTVISSRVVGWLTELPVDEGDRIKAGQVLARIDSRDAELQVTQLGAELAAIAAERARTEAEIHMIDERTGTRADNERAQVQSLQAVVAARASELALAREEYVRGEQLSAAKVMAQRDWDRVRTAFLQAQHAHARAQADVAAARAKQAEVETERLQIGMLRQEIARLGHREAEVDARLRRARTDVEDRAIRSPIDGIVDRRFVRLGEYVDAGQRIFMIHDPRDVRIEANIRETHVGRLKVGQRVAVKVDAYPGHDVVGKVTRVGTTATSNFALLPTPNPSGNFTKVTQRLPVRIDIVENGLLLSPGMMVEVVVDVGDR